MKKRIAIITTGYFPVPATRGGAVENLVENLINENERKGNVDLNIFSAYDKKAEKLSRKYKNTSFEYKNT